MRKRIPERGWDMAPGRVDDYLRDAGMVAVRRQIPDDLVQRAAELISSHEESAEADAGFDGGEFSAPAHDRMLERALERLARKHHVDPDDLRSAAEVWMDAVEEPCVAPVRKVEYVRCVACGTVDESRKPIFGGGAMIREGHVGTSVEMRCEDCAVGPELYRGRQVTGRASKCRACCPSGHRTRSEVAS